MGDWDDFVEDASWFLRSGSEVTVADGSRSWGRPPIDDLPVLSALFETAAVTDVVVDGQPYELLAWGPADGRRGWLCLPPEPDASADLSPMHRRFLAVCGGIVERFGEPSSWWLNQNQVLTVAVSATDLAGILDAYSWAWEDDGLEVPIAPEDHAVVAFEANGNLTLAHRRTDAVTNRGWSSSERV